MPDPYAIPEDFKKRLKETRENYAWRVNKMTGAIRAYRIMEYPMPENLTYYATPYCPIAAVCGSFDANSNPRAFGKRIGLSDGQVTRIVTVSDYDRLALSQNIEARQQILEAIGLEEPPSM